MTTPAGGWTCECGALVPWGVSHGHAPALTVGTSFRPETTVTRGPGTINSAFPAEWRHSHVWGSGECDGQSRDDERVPCGCKDPTPTPPIRCLCGHPIERAAIDLTTARMVIAEFERVLSVDNVARALNRVGMNDPHWSWRCHHPSKGEQPCDLTDEAEAFTAALTEDVP